MSGDADYPWQEYNKCFKVHPSMFMPRLEHGALDLTFVRAMVTIKSRYFEKQAAGEFGPTADKIILP